MPNQTRIQSCDAKGEIVSNPDRSDRCIASPALRLKGETGAAELRQTYVTVCRYIYVFSFYVPLCIIDFYAYS